MASKITLSDEQLNLLYEAQRVHLINTLQTNRNGDDGGDYITSALDVFQILQQATCDQSDTGVIEFWLNTPHVPMASYLHYKGYQLVQLNDCAGDGICGLIYELDPIALQEDYQ